MARHGRDTREVVRSNINIFCSGDAVVHETKKVVANIITIAHAQTLLGTKAQTILTTNATTRTAAMTRTANADAVPLTTQTTREKTANTAIAPLTGAVAHPTSPPPQSRVRSKSA